MRRAYLHCLSRPLFFVIWPAQTKQTLHSCNCCCSPFASLSGLQLACLHAHEASCMQVQARGTPPASQPLGGRQSPLWSFSLLQDAPTLPCCPLGHALAFAAAKHASSGHTQTCPAQQSSPSECLMHFPSTSLLNSMQDHVLDICSSPAGPRVCKCTVSARAGHSAQRPVHCKPCSRPPGYRWVAHRAEHIL